MAGLEKGDRRKRSGFVFITAVSRRRGEECEIL